MSRTRDLPHASADQPHAAVAGWLDEQARHASTTPRGCSRSRIIASTPATPACGSAYRQAGMRCLELFAYGEATAALRKAVALIAVPDPVLDEALGDALKQTEGYAAAEPSYQRALDETDDDDARHARASLQARRRREPSAATRGTRSRASRPGLAIAAPGGQPAAWTSADSRTPALLWAELGWTLGYQLGQVEEGHPLVRARGRACSSPLPHRRDLAHVLSRLGGTYMRACRFADQLRCNQRNLEIAVELADLNMQLTANVNLGVVYGVLGFDLEQAVAATLAARKLAARTGSAASDGLAASNLAGYYIELGRLDEADALLDSAFATIERTGSHYFECESWVFRARIAAARGKLSTARQHAERSLALARSLGNQLDVAVATRILAALDSRIGDHENARQRIEEALVGAVIHDELEAIKTRAARARILAAASEETADSELDDLQWELERIGAKRDLAVLRDLHEVR